MVMSKRILSYYYCTSEVTVLRRVLFIKVGTYYDDVGNHQHYQPPLAAASIKYIKSFASIPGLVTLIT